MSRPHPRSPWSVVWPVLLAGLLPAQDGGLEVIAGDLRYGQGVRASLTEIYKVERSLQSGTQSRPDPFARTWEELRTVVGLDYDPGDDFGLAVLLPVVRRQLQGTGMDMTVDGLGDISVLARQRFCLDDRRRRHRDAGDDGGFDLSLIGGLELPTGQTGAAGNGVRNPVEVQAGSGSFDPFLGGLARLDLGRSRLQALVLYKFNTEGAQQHQAGDAFVGSFSGRVPLVGEEYRGPAVEANLGLQYKHRGRAEQFDTPLASSGADELFVQIGLGARPRPHLDVALSLDLPIYSHYDGTQLARDYQINFRFGIRF